MIIAPLPTNWSERLNQSCHCFEPQHQKHTAILSARLDDLASDARQFSSFSNAPVFLDKKHHRQMIDLVGAVERVSQSKKYLELITQRQPNLPRSPHINTSGLMMGYDFHITPNGPRLIEINTNAGGAFISKMLNGSAFAKINCCGALSQSSEASIEASLVDSFRREFVKAHPNQTLKTVAIVDAEPESQFLYFDTLLAQQLLLANGIETHICDVGALEHTAHGVFFRGSKIDLVYNRHTDFMLTNPESKTLRVAYEAGDIVLSPSPVHHALYADKRNLEILGHADQMQAWGVDEETSRALAIIPKTHTVNPKLGDKWWSKRKNYFFKPKDGFGGRAVYRGDKVTKKVWSHISNGGYLAQEFVPPSLRQNRIEDAEIALKYDIRVFAYAGEPLFTVARSYQGQTTNFRTPGSGFSEVILI